MKFYYIFKAFWWWVIRKRIILDRSLNPKGCSNWYVNLITGEFGICRPEKVKKKTWWGRVIGERKMIKKRRGYYYYVALNDRNGKRKAKQVLNIFQGNV